MLNLSEDDTFGPVFHFIEDGDSEGCLGTPGFNWHIIEDVEERRAIIPAASAVVNWVFYIGTCQSRNWNPVEVLL